MYLHIWFDPRHTYRYQILCYVIDLNLVGLFLQHLITVLLLLLF